jgi:hypothetical protein
MDHPMIMNLYKFWTTVNIKKYIYNFFIFKILLIFILEFIVKTVIITHCQVIPKKKNLVNLTMIT